MADLTSEPTADISREYQAAIPTDYECSALWQTGMIRVARQHVPHHHAVKSCSTRSHSKKAPSPDSVCLHFPAESLTSHIAHWTFFSGSLWSFYNIVIKNKSVCNFPFKEWPKRKKAYVICFTHDLISDKTPWQRSVTAWCLHFLSSDILHSWTFQEAQTFPSCPSSWWAVL